MPGIVFELGAPVLRICHGLHAMAAELGGRVEASDVKVFGYARVDVHDAPRLLRHALNAANARSTAPSEFPVIDRLREAAERHG